MLLSQDKNGRKHKSLLMSTVLEILGQGNQVRKQTDVWSGKQDPILYEDVLKEYRKQLLALKNPAMF